MLGPYLARVRLSRPLAADISTLIAVHRAQAMTVPYEAIDVFAGKPVSQDIVSIQNKIIVRQRGGWCYETNRLLAWALAALGFDVRLAAAAAYNHQMGDDDMGGHVVPIVTLDGSEWLCDLGLGDALRQPIPLREGEHRDGPFMFRLERLGNKMWRFWNHSFGDPTNFVMDTGPVDENRIARKHAELQANPQSSFRKNFQIMQMRPTGATIIYGRVLRQATAESVSKTLIAGPKELEGLLSSEFGLGHVEIGSMWPVIVSRHAEVFGQPDAIPI